jgi:hypothetical protein
VLKVRNNQTGQVEEIPENQIAQAVASGQYSLQQGVKLPVLSPDGTPGTIDSSEAYTAFQSGFSYETNEQQQERRKQKEFGDRPVAAAALGAARSLSFGLSDQALVGSGLAKDETLREIKDRNSELSTVGEIAGIFAPGLGIAKGLGAGVKGVATAGTAAEKAVARAITRRSWQRLGATGESTLAKKVLANAGAKATGSAVEGAFYGAGHIISEDALGNAELNAESLLANVGMGALIGGAAGGVLGGVGAVGKAGLEASKKLTEPIQPFFRKLLGAKDLPDEVGILGSLGQLKNDVGDLRNRAQRLEVELTTGAQSANQRVRDAESILNETPSIFGQEVQRVAERNRTKLQRGASEVFEEASQRTEREVGRQVVDEMKTILQKKYDPFNIAYEEIRKHTPHIDIDMVGMNRTAKNISKLGGKLGAKGGDIAAATEREALLIGQQRTLQDLRNYISEVKGRSRQQFQSGNSPMGYALKEVAKKAEALEKRTILREADKLARLGAPDAQLVGKQLISNIRTTNREYAEFMQFLRAFGDEGRLGKARNFSQVIEKLDSLDPETVAKKFFDPNRMDAINFMQKNFPSQFEELRRLKLAQLAEEVSERNPTHGLQYNMAALERNFDKLGKTPEYREVLFGKKGVQTIDDVVTLNKAIPGVSNPSRTDIRKDFERLLTPVLWARDAALLGILKGAKNVSQESQAVRGMQGLAQVEKSQKKISKVIKTTVDRFLRGAERVKDTTPAATTNFLMDTFYSEKRKKDDTPEAAFQSRADEIARFVGNPALLQQNLEMSTAGLANVAPKTAQALQIKVNQTVQFLNSKLPSNPAAGRTSNLAIRKWKPSTVELKKFERYMRAVEKPISVIKDLDRGVVNREGVETLKVVYPEIYGNLVREVTDRIAELRTDLPYKKRLLLSNLLDVPIDLAQEPDFLASLQMEYTPDEEEQQQDGAVKPTAKAMSNINVASQNETETQRISKS